MSTTANAVIGGLRWQVLIRRIRLAVLAENCSDRAIRTGQLTGQDLRANEKQEEHRCEAKRFSPECHPSSLALSSASVHRAVGPTRSNKLASYPVCSLLNPAMLQRRATTRTVAGDDLQFDRLMCALTWAPQRVKSRQGAPRFREIAKGLIRSATCVTERAMCDKHRRMNPFFGVGYL